VYIYISVCVLCYIAAVNDIIYNIFIRRPILYNEFSPGRSVQTFLTFETTKCRIKTDRFLMNQLNNELRRLHPTIVAQVYYMHLISHILRLCRL